MFGLILQLLLCASVWLPQDASSEDAGNAAYRRGDYALAKSVWVDELRATEAPFEKARLLHNIGNACYRDGAAHEAVGWYTAALRITPRDGDTWTNLELARVEAGLAPADRGDLGATSKRVLSSLTLAESEWLVVSLMLLFAGCLAGEALRGGRVWQRLALASFCLLVIGALPLLFNYARADRGALLVIAPKGVEARSEPRPDAKRIAKVDSGTEVVQLDQLPGWIKVRVPAGDEAWVQDDKVFDLVW